ncbi:hypothetical protein R5W23_003215 [Gemmata sp. JC673]|uniref:Uncharacterized protein n=1 Tax=Gemmata algarum TaxID=2975278 RepID=A0ABU5F2H0_9BACT|nr:hypothetical protein [Gemmata algarum]MDY3561787.1 hypothetical protein [Gemmata algarum]
MATVPSFEDVDKHIQAADLTAIQPGGKSHPAAGVTGAAALPNICPAYKTVRPILVLASNTPLLPQKWRDAIKAFIGVLDVICP